VKFSYGSQRKEYGKALVELGHKRSDIVVLDADLSGSTQTALFAKEFPDRFFNCGIAEANLMGTAAGLAAGGKCAFASTFAIFATGRAWEQVRQSIAYPQLNVKIAATHAGLTVGEDGASHQTLEDVALMRTIPNMRIVVPADPLEARNATFAVAEAKGPYYLRMGRVDCPLVTEPEATFKIGKASVLRDGADITLMSMGVMAGPCLEAAECLQQKGISARVVNMSTIKPLDEEMVLRCAKETGFIVTAEEHNVLSGLGSAVASVLAEHRPTRMKMVGVQDMFGQSGGTNELLEKYGLTSADIANAAESLRK
jgi:transketolase